MVVDDESTMGDWVKDLGEVQNLGWHGKVVHLKAPNVAFVCSVQMKKVLQDKEMEALQDD